MEDVWAVVVNWNGGASNDACLRSLRAQGLAPERIVFVDNGSTDGSLEAVRRDHPGLVLALNERNLGYGAGTNQGIEHALERGAEAVLLLNNDATLPEGALVRLVSELRRDSRIGIVGPRIVYQDDPATIWCAGGRLTFRQNLSTLLGHKKSDGPRYRRTQDVDYLPGCAMLVRREVFERAGLFEADYFAYHEDLEFCLEARAAGFTVRVVGEVLAFHEAHRSTGGGYNARRKYMMGVNTIWFLRRHGNPARWASFVLFDVLTLPVAFLLRSLRGEGRAVAAKARGMYDGLRGVRVTEATGRTSLEGEEPARPDKAA